jgi:hypothetical protein
MCGRYRLTAKERYLRDHFGLVEDPTWTPRWNISPTQLVPVVRQKNTSSRRSFDLVRWGLIPSWTKNRSIATKTINAMSETAAEKPALGMRCTCDAVSSRPAASISGSRTVQSRDSRSASAWPMTRHSPSRDSGNRGPTRVAMLSKPVRS